jgi:FKBP-type peptidyl-prolyl cis-trans isomerase
MSRLLATVVLLLGLAPVLEGQAHKIPPLPAEAAKPVRLRSGVTIVDLEVGKGVQARRGRVVRILYTGWIDKTEFMFDHRGERNNPLAFRIGAAGIIRGLSEGVVGMRVGGTRRIRIPAALAHGSKGTQRIPPNSDLTYDVELVGVSRPGA